MYKEFEKGEMAEGLPWEIAFDEEILVYDEYARKVLCEHAYYKGKGPWPSQNTNETYCIPRAIICYNEGGYNSTTLCLDCLLEQVNNLEKEV